MESVVTGKHFSLASPCSCECVCTEYGQVQTHMPVSFCSNNTKDLLCFLFLSLNNSKQNIWSHAAVGERSQVQGSCSTKIGLAQVGSGNPVGQAKNEVKPAVREKKGKANETQKYIKCLSCRHTRQRAIFSFIYFKQWDSCQTLFLKVFMQAVPSDAQNSMIISSPCALCQNRSWSWPYRYDGLRYPLGGWRDPKVKRTMVAAVCMRRVF